MEKSKQERTQERARKKAATSVNAKVRTELDAILGDPLAFSDVQLERVYKHIRDHAAARIAIICTQDDHPGSGALERMHDMAVRGLVALREAAASIDAEDFYDHAGGDRIVFMHSEMVPDACDTAE